MQGNHRHIITSEIIQTLPTQLLLAWSALHFFTTSFNLYPQVSIAQFTIDYLVLLVSQLAPSVNFCGFLACRRCLGRIKASHRLTGFDCGLLDYISCLVFRVRNEGRDKCPNSLLLAHVVAPSQEEASGYLRNRGIPTFNTIPAPPSTSTTTAASTSAAFNPSHLSRPSHYGSGKKRHTSPSPAAITPVTFQFAAGSHLNITSIWQPLTTPVDGSNASTGSCSTCTSASNTSSSSSVPPYNNSFRLPPSPSPFGSNSSLYHTSSYTHSASVPPFSNPHHSHIDNPHHLDNNHSSTTPSSFDFSSSSPVSSASIHARTSDTVRVKRAHTSTEPTYAHLPPSPNATSPNSSSTNASSSNTSTSTFQFSSYLPFSSSADPRSLGFAEQFLPTSTTSTPSLTAGYEHTRTSESVVDTTEWFSTGADGYVTE